LSRKILSRVFEEISDDNTSNETTVSSSDNTLTTRIKEKFNNTSLETVDFLTEFFEQLDDD